MLWLTIYNDTIGSEEGLLAYYRFNEASGFVFYPEDYSVVTPNPHTGSLTAGMAWTISGVESLPLNVDIVQSQWKLIDLQGSFQTPGKTPNNWLVLLTLVASLFSIVQGQIPGA